MSLLKTFFQTFIPLFVAIDAFGLLPLFLSFTARMGEEKKRHITLEAVATALVICVGFMFLGKPLFHYLAITDNDFRIAGGIILLVLAILDLLIQGKPSVHEQEMIGIVPLAMPLIAGPACLTTVLVLAGNVGYGWTALSLVVNFLILLAVLRGAATIARLLGMHTLQAVSKLVMVLLAAIAVNFIRVGIMQAIKGG